MVYLPALRVSSNQLTELSIGIGGLEACSDLLAAENYLEALPAQIGLLTNITRLRVSNNRLTSLPTEVGNLYNMTELSVNDNQLRELPALGHLTSLRSLLVANNPLKLPPDRIIRKGTFAMVNYLRVLYEAGGAPPEVVERGQPSVEAFHETVQVSFSKVFYIVTSDSKYARALTFANLCPGRARLSQAVLARPPARGRAHAGHCE